MKTYATVGWKQKAVFAVFTVAIGVGALELVAGAMTHPDPGALAARAPTRCGRWKTAR